MAEHALDPQMEYEVLADALQLFQAQEAHPTAQSITLLQEAVTRAIDAWQRCESVRATREKEFRYHVVKLKMLLTGAYQTLEALSGERLPEAT